MKKSLLFIMPSLSSGGAEKSLVTLLALLDYESYDVDLFLFRKTGLFVSRIPSQVNVITAGEDYELFDGNIKKALKGFLKRGRPKYAIDRIRYSFALRKSGEKRDKAAWKYLSRVLPGPSKEYDAAIGYLEGTSIYYCVDKVRAIKKVGYLHTDYNRIIAQRSMDEAYFEKLDNIVGVSQKCCDILTGIFPNLSKKTTVIENIISQKMISEMSQCNDKLFDTDDETVILTIGRLSPPKGIGNAVLACARLIEMGYRIKWYQIGTGELKAHIEELVKAKGLEKSFIMLGERENPYPYIKQCDIYVQPSDYEGKAIAVDEVKCLKKPIVVTDFETVFDQIEDGVNGIIAKRDPEDIALKIKLLIDCPERRAELSENLGDEKTGNEEELKKFCSLINNEF
jgi:glycosyltransferase involved in cell wall biosynthesis